MPWQKDSEAKKLWGKNMLGQKDSGAKKMVGKVIAKVGSAVD